MNFKGKRLADRLLLFYIRKVPDHPVKRRLVNKINDAWFKDGVQLEKNQACFHLSTREQTGLGLMIEDEYEPLTMKLAETILSGGGVLFDIGANMGLWSIQLSKIKNVAVYSIEPSFEIFALLQKNMHSSGAKNITPINLALSNADGFGYMFNQHPKNLGTMKVVNDRQDGAYLVRLCTLADLLGYLNIQRIRLMKIDVEGFELNVLKGLFAGDNAVRPENLIMEFNELIERTGYTQQESFDYIISQGYKPFNMLGQVYIFGEDMPESNLLFKYTGAD
jgi:FkbM family methyltransferase